MDDLKSPERKQNAPVSSDAVRSAEAKLAKSPPAEHRTATHSEQQQLRQAADRCFVDPNERADAEHTLNKRLEANKQGDTVEQPATDAPEAKTPFTNEALGRDHFNKHGQEFDPPYKTKQAYEAGAKQLLSGDAPQGTLQKMRNNGDIVRYNPATKEFGTARADGKIRTYFIPDPSKHGRPTNLDYFNEQ